MAKEWVRNAHNKTDAKIYSWGEVEKSLGALKEDYGRLNTKLKETESARLSTEAGLKNVQTQIEDQCQSRYLTEIDLVTKKAMVLSLKAELQKAKDKAQAIREVVEATEMAAYERGVVETEQRLAEEVAEVCKDYYTITWNEALNSAGVPANFKLRKVENMFYPKHIREVPANLPSTAPPLPPPE